MEIFKQKRVLIRIILLLSFLDLLLLGAFFWKEVVHRPPPPDSPGIEHHTISSLLRQELKLSDQQVEQLKNLRSDFMEKEKVLSEKIRQERDSMNGSMFNKTTDEAQVIFLAHAIAEHEFQMEMMRFEQAKKFKSICTPEQLAKFENLVKEVRDYFKPDDKPKKPEGKK
jgi:periplasmic protein CpxP/Spy